MQDICWKQRFENFEKPFKLLEKYLGSPISIELDRMSRHYSILLIIGDGSTASFSNEVKEGGSINY
jgi:hypothetical protein